MDGQGQMFIGNKKKNNPIDEDTKGKNGKYYKKYQNKSLANAKLIQQIQQSKKANGRPKENTGKPGLDPKVQKKIDDIKSILEHHKQDTILKALQNHNYNQQEALEQLFNLPADEQELQAIVQQKVETKQRNSKVKLASEKQQMANDLLNEIYDSKQEIDPSQFEELFAEIAQIIQQEQKNNGMNLFQINELIDDCFLIKNVILKDQSQIYIDQNDQLCRQTQLFMEELIKNQVAKEIKRQQDFPTLASVSKSPAQCNKSTIQLIQEGYKKQSHEQQYFTPNKTPQIYGRKPSAQQYSLFTVNNNPRSYSDVLQLSKEYSEMGIDKLKFIYLRLEDINLCKRFLDKYYADKKKEIKKDKPEDRKALTPAIRKNSEKLSYKRLEDENFKDHSLRQIRDQLDHLFKRRIVFRMTRGKITNVAHRKELDRLSHLDDPRINKLCEVARFKTIEQMASGNPQFIDLHGYREEEIDELFYEIEDMVKQLFRKGSSLIETTKSGANVYVVVKALTGKGLHSKYGRSVLKPAIKDWCSRNDVKCAQTEDSINVYIQVMH